MPNTREKLIELLRYVQYLGGLEEKVADYLIANGVTIQDDHHWATEQAYKNGYADGQPKWISVEERLPKGMDWVLCACKDGEVRILAYDFIMDDWDIHGRPNSWYGKAFVTHWMPLPEPPKGE